MTYRNVKEYATAGQSNPRRQPGKGLLGMLGGPAGSRQPDVVHGIAVGVVHTECRRVLPHSPAAASSFA